jgi:hypothetical protein
VGTSSHVSGAEYCVERAGCSRSKGEEAGAIRAHAALRRIKLAHGDSWKNIAGEMRDDLTLRLNI